MTIEHMGGANGQAHIEIWGKKTEMTALQYDSDKINSLVNEDADIVFFTLDEAELYYLDKISKIFKVIGE